MTDSSQHTSNRHRKQVRHYHEPGDVHEFTFSCFHRLPLLTNDDWRRQLSRAIDRANDAQAFRLLAFVFMPEHMHVIACPTSMNADIPAWLGGVKRPVAAYVKRTLQSNQNDLLKKLTVRERPGKMAFRFWQEGPGYDRNLQTEAAIRAAIDYVHMNPVRRKLCARPDDWKWSSARHYLSGGSRPDPDLPHIHPVTRDDFAF